MGRRRDSEGLVREDQVAAVVPYAAGRHAAPACRRRRATPISTSDRRPRSRARSPTAARAHGFDIVGIARPDSIPRAGERLRAFLAAGEHGDMEWMAKNAERRGDPRTLWPEVRSVVMLGVNYGPADDPLAILQAARRAAPSRSTPRATTITS